MSRLRGVSWEGGTAFLCAALLHLWLAGHRPDIDGADLSAVATVVRAANPLAHLVDAATSRLPVLWQDVEPLSLLLLAAAAALAATWSTALGAPRWLAVSAGVGLSFQTHAWRTHGRGSDPLLLIASLIVVAAVWRRDAERGRRAWRAIPASVVALIAAPALAWSLVPALARGLDRRRRLTRVGLPVLVVAAVAGTAAAVAAAARTLCGATPGPGALVAAVWRPAEGTAVWSLVRMGDLAARLVAEWHVLGILLALAGIWTFGDRLVSLRRPGLAAVVGVMLAALLGAVDPSVAVPWLTAWWLPCQVLGAVALWQHARGPGRRLAHVALVVLLTAVPVLSHAERKAGPLTNDLVHLRASAFGQGPSHAMAVGDVRAARLARQADARLVPATAGAVSACLTAGIEVHTLGIATVPRREVTEAARTAVVATVPLALEIPLPDLVDDIGRGTVLGLAVTPAGLRWLRPRDATALAAAGVPGVEAGGRETVTIVGRLPLSAEAARHGGRASHDDAQRDAGGVSVLPRIVATADATSAGITWGREAAPVVTADLAALAAFDDLGRATLGALAQAAPGLVMRVRAEQPALRLARAVLLAPAEAAQMHGPPLLPMRRVPALDASTLGALDLRAGEGWHAAEPAGPRTFRWSGARRATATFVLAGPSALLLRVDAAPAATGDRPNRLALVVNDRIAADDLAGPRTIAVDAADTRAGVNTVALLTDTVLPPGTVAGDARALAAIVRDLVIAVR